MFAESLLLTGVNFKCNAIAFSSACRAEAIVFLGSADLAGVVEEEGVVEGHASKPWPLALMPSW